MRRTVAEVNAVSTGIILVASFARFKASIAMLSEERESSCPFGRWDLVAMVEGSCEKSMRNNPSRNKDGRSFCHYTPRDWTHLVEFAWWRCDRLINVFVYSPTSCSRCPYKDNLHLLTANASLPLLAFDSASLVATSFERTCTKTKKQIIKNRKWISSKRQRNRWK